MQLPKCPLPAIITGLLLFSFNQSRAQLQAYGGRSTDNNCKIIYLVNPSADSIYYIAGVEQNSLEECLTFSTEQDKTSEKYLINVSKYDGAYLLLLPKDTIAYNIIIPSEQDVQEKELILLSRLSPSVIATNDDKKRNKKIGKLAGRWMRLAITE